MTETVQQSESPRKPGLFLIAEEMLNHARYVYGDGDYRWHCGNGVRQKAFEVATVVSIEPPSDEEIERHRNAPDTFTFCGLHARVSHFLPFGRLELYRWADFKMTRISLFEFPFDPHY